MGVGLLRLGTGTALRPNLRLVSPFFLPSFRREAVFNFLRLPSSASPAEWAPRRAHPPGVRIPQVYAIFNMLEMFERWCRSIGVDLFDLVMASARQPWRDLMPKYLWTLLYCFVHSVMHLLRVLLLHVAFNTSSSAVFLIIVTNNFGEIKSTVFKRYEAKSLFPIVASDIVERFYLLADILFVLAYFGCVPGVAQVEAPTRCGGSDRPLQHRPRGQNRMRTNGIRPNPSAETLVSGENPTLIRLGPVMDDPHH